MRYWQYILRFFQKQPTYKPDGHSIAKCEKCLHLLKNNSGPRLIQHLNEEHGLNHDASIATVEWITLKVYRQKLEAYEQLRNNRRG